MKTSFVNFLKEQDLRKGFSTTVRSASSHHIRVEYEVPTEILLLEYRINVVISDHIPDRYEVDDSGTEVGSTDVRNIDSLLVKIGKLEPFYLNTQGVAIKTGHGIQSDATYQRLLYNISQDFKAELEENDDIKIERFRDVLTDYKLHVAIAKTVIAHLDQQEDQQY
jgi:hypothetical protein